MIEQEQAHIEAGGYRMKKKSIVLAAILTLTMSFSCTAWAAESAEEPAPENEDSKLSALFEEGGPLDKLFG